MLVSEFRAVLEQVRSRNLPDVCVQVSQVAMGSNIGSAALSRVEVRDLPGCLDSLPDDPDMRPDPIPECWEPGRRLVLVIGDEVWEDPPKGCPSDSPDLHWELQTGPCATVRQVLAQLEGVPDDLLCVGMYAMPGSGAVSVHEGPGATGAPLVVDGREVDLENLLQGLADAIYHDGVVWVTDASFCEERAPEISHIPEYTGDRHCWMVGDREASMEEQRASPETPGLEFRKVGTYTTPAEDIWETGTRACVVVGTWG